MRPFIVFLSVILLISCSKGKNEPAESPGAIAGMGSDERPFTGTPFNLPQGLQLVNELIPGYDLNRDLCNAGGTGEYVVLEIKVKNNLLVDTAITFPAGLIFEFAQHASGHQADGDYQDGILLERMRFPVPRNGIGTGGICSIKLMLYCLNKRKRPADNPGALYKIGPVTNSKLMQELLQLLKNKKIAFSNQPDYVSMSESIQEVVWHITDGNGLTNADRDFIETLPSK